MSLNEPFVVIRLVVIVIVRVIDLFFIFYDLFFIRTVIIVYSSNYSIKNTRDTSL